MSPDGKDHRRPMPGDGVATVLDLLKLRFGVDTKAYDPGIVAHCVENRLLLHCFRAFDDYMELLRTDDKELQELCDELAGAASLPEAFDELEREVIPRLPPSTGGPVSRGQGRQSWRPARLEPSSEPDDMDWVARGKQFLLNEFAPPSVLVDAGFHVVHTFCGGARFLRHPDGRPSLAILDLVTPSLRSTLTGALQRASRDASKASYGRVRVPAEHGDLDVRVSVLPIAADRGQPHYLIVLEPQDRVDTDGASCVPTERLRALEREHRHARDAFHAAIEELQATNAELRTAVEELEIANSELQGANARLSAANTALRNRIQHADEERELTHVLIEATDVGVILLSADLRIRRFTGLAARIFQLLPQDIGRTFQTFAHVLDRPELLSIIKSAIDENKPEQLEARSRSGAWYRLRIAPLRGSRTEGAVLSFVDISAVKQAASELWLASRVFMDGADPVVIESLDGHVLAINAEAGSAYGNPDELLGVPADALVAPECVEKTRELKARCREMERVRNIELVHRTKQGGRRPVLVTLALLRDERGRPAAIATMAEDIGRLKRAEREARLAVQRRDHFLAMLSHELRNPLGALQNAACVMQRRSEDTQAMVRALEVVQRQTRHMARLLDDLLDISRITQGKIEIRHETVDMVELAQDCLQSLRPVIEGRGQSLHVDLADPPLCVRGDPSRLVQILENLLTNASKYTHEGGEIWFTLEPHEEEALIRVKDNGEGIPGEMLESIFELFTQSQRTSARSNGGMGVGLMLVRSLARLHGGDVRVRSDGPGRGAEFLVRLPLKRDDNHDIDPTGEARASTGKRILIVEDNADARDMLKTLLELDGFEVRVAGDGISGLNSIMEAPPDVALIDIGLPGVDGLHLARRVRKAFGTTGIRLVALTGFGRSEDRRAVSDAGFDAHLVKPVVREELYAALQRCSAAVTLPGPKSPQGLASGE